MTLLYLTVAWAAGILLSHSLWSRGLIGCETPPWPFAIVSGLAAAALILLHRRPTARLVPAVVLFLILGTWRYQAHPFDACATPDDLAYYNGNGAQRAQVVLEGIVTGYPDVREAYTNYVLSAETLTIGGQTRRVRGKALVRARPFPAYHYGDRLHVRGSLQEPPVFNDFDYRAYLAREEIYSLMRTSSTERTASGQGSPIWTLVYGLRERGSALLSRVLPEPSAALANGMLLGIEGGIPEDLYEDYRTAGVAHLIVISGSNISLLAGALALMFARPLGRRRAVLPILLGVFVYVLVAGAQPPTLRAGFMAALFLVAILVGRQNTAWVSLVAAALCMTVINPLALWDASFQLSFMATLGLILFGPEMFAALERWLGGRQLPGMARKTIVVLSGLLIATLAAQVLVTPLMLYYFGRLSLIAIPANLLVLPAQPPVMAGGMATLVGGLLWEPLGRVLATIPLLFLTYTNVVVRAAAALKFASVETGAPSALLVVLFYGVLFGVLAARRIDLETEAGSPPASRNLLPAGRAAAWAAAVTVPLWAGLSILGSMPDGRLHVVFVTEGQREAALVVTPDGRRLWVGDLTPRDPRPPASVLDSRGPIVSRMPDVVIASSTSGSTATGASVIEAVGLPVGAVIDTGDGVTLTKLDAGEGWALRLCYGEFQALLPSTLSQGSQATLLGNAGNQLHASLLVTPGPLSRAWPSPELLAAAAPQLVFWPEEAVYPPAVAEWLEQHDAFRVPGDALIEVVTDGERMWLRVHSRVVDG